MAGGVWASLGALQDVKRTFTLPAVLQILLRLLEREGICVRQCWSVNFPEGTERQNRFSWHLYWLAARAGAVLQVRISFAKEAVVSWSSVLLPESCMRAERLQQKFYYHIRFHRDVWSHSWHWVKLQQQCE